MQLTLLMIILITALIAVGWWLASFRKELFVKKKNRRDTEKLKTRLIEDGDAKDYNKML